MISDTSRGTTGGDPSAATPVVQQPSGVDVLVRYPGMGSIWLGNAQWAEDFVEGEAWDRSEVGSSYMPDDFHGEKVWMNFPLTCVVKVSAREQLRAQECGRSVPLRTPIENEQ